MTFISQSLFSYPMKSTLIVLFTIFLLGSCSIYNKNYAEAYKITTAMTLQQKVGQTIQVSFGALVDKAGTDPSLATKYFLGSVLANGDDAVDSNGNVVVIPDKEDQIIATYLNSTSGNWKALADKFNNIGAQVTTAQGKTFKMRLLLGTDAVHGNQHVIGEVIFPHNSGLSCSHNEKNFYNVGYWTGQSVKKIGFNYAFAPTVAVSHNPQWGRFYQTMGQEDAYIRNYSKAFVQGMQSIDASGKWAGVLSSVKHFMADGATLYGADQGDAMVYSFKNFIKHNVQGYIGGVEAEAGSVMVSYSAVNGVPMALNPMIQNVLRKDVGFDGFVISDYDELNAITKQQLPTSYINMTDYQAYATMLNAGVDMFMVPSSYGARGIEQIFNGVFVGTHNNSFDISRLDEAVTRIVSVKLAMGVIQQVKSKNIMEEGEEQETPRVLDVKQSSASEDSLNAVRESLVVLKNQNSVLPVKNFRSNIKYVVLVGERIINVNHLSKNQLFRDFDNIGVQCGGWTVRWQGFEGSELWTGANKVATNASSILDGLNNLKGNFSTIYPNYTSFSNTIKIEEDRTKYLNQLKTLKKEMHANNTVIIGVIAESPYAETEGDVGIPYCKNSIFGGEGCRYYGTNPYLPEKQRTTLALDYDSFSRKVINEVLEQDKNISLITVMLAGRPMEVNNALKISTAFIAGWLPGTSGGQGIVDAISGDYVVRPKGSNDRTNTLSFDWPANETALEDFPVYLPSGEIPRIEGSLFQVGFGISTA